MIQINRVVTKNFIEDIIAKFQNLFGMNLTGYQKMIDKGHEQIQDEEYRHPLSEYDDDGSPY